MLFESWSVILSSLKSRILRLGPKKREGRRDFGAEGAPVIKQFNILDQELDIELDPVDNVWKLASDSELQYVKRAMVGFTAEGSVKMGAIKVTITILRNDVADVSPE